VDWPTFWTWFGPVALVAAFMWMLAFGVLLLLGVRMPPLASLRRSIW
jgi:hypothetical protein